MDNLLFQGCPFFFFLFSFFLSRKLWQDFGSKIPPCFLFVCFFRVLLAYLCQF